MREREHLFSTSALENHNKIPQSGLNYLQESHLRFTTREGRFGELQCARGVLMGSPRKRC
jgi:hypothetical protein